MTGAGPGCVSEEMGWPGVELVLLSCALLYMRRKWAHGGISKRLRARADRGYDWQGASISPENGGGRAGKVGWRRMPPGVCWLRAAIKKLGVLLLALELC